MDTISPSADLRASPRSARIGFFFSGLVLYSVIGLFLGAWVEDRLRDAGHPVSWRLDLAVAAALGVLAAVRGAGVAATVRPDALVIRNRWLTRTVPWPQVERITVSASVGYTVVYSAKSLLELFSRNVHGPTLRLQSSLLSVHRLGRHLGIPVYATMGNPLANPVLAPFRRALAAAGHPIEGADDSAVADEPPVAAVPVSAETVELPMGYRTNATVFGERPGTLRVTAERLTFTETGGEVRIDAPLRELHSVHLAEMDTALDVWHGSTRHRLVVPPGPGPTAAPGAVQVTPLEIAQGVRGYGSQKAVARALAAMLASRVGPRPEGVRVRRPAGTVRYTLQVLAIVLAITGAIIGAVFLLA